MDRLTAGLERDNPDNEHMAPKRGRHLFTQADRRRGCAVARGRAGGRKAQASGKAHKLTSEERRRGGLATAAKRRKERTRKLLDTLRQPSGSELPDCTPSMRGQVPAKRGSESLLSNPKDWVDVIPVADLRALGASLAGKLMAGEGAIRALTTEAMKLHTVNPPPPDPFTLSALKRFRLGPKSPLHLTRSQRAQVDVMIAGGWLMATGDSMLALTSKGRQAIETEGGHV